MTERRILPQARELEEAVLSICLQKPNAEIEAIGYLQPSDFYSEQNRLIFEAIVELAQLTEPVDMLTVNEKLKELGYQETVPVGKLVELTQLLPAASSMEKYCRIIKQKSIRREMIQDGLDRIQKAYDDTEDVFEILDSTDLKISEIKHQIQKGRKTTKAAILQSMVKRIESGGFDSVTGVQALDNVLFSADPGDLIILAGRPGMGKSMMANTIAEHWSIKKNRKVFFWGLEMTSEQNMMRYTANVGNMDFNVLKKGGFDWSEFERTSKKIMKAPIEFEDVTGVNALEIRSRLISEKKSRGLDIAIIDHGGLMQNINAKNTNQVNEISKTSGLMKQAAKELNIPIILLWQLNRSVETRGGWKMPQLSDLRDSGSLEQDADKVIFLYRPEYYDFDNFKFRNTEYDTSGLALAMVEKNRNGAVGRALMSFVPEFMRFQEFQGYMPTVAELPSYDESIF